MKQQNVAQGRIHKYTDPRAQNDCEMQFDDNMLRTPVKARNNGVTEVKFEKKSLMSSQKNLVSPSPIKNDSFRNASPPGDEGHRALGAFSPTAVELQAKGDHLLTNNILKTTKTKRDSQAQLSNLKSEPNSTRQQIRHDQSESMTFNQAHVADEGFINLQRSSQKHSGEGRSSLPRVGCFDRSYDSRRGASSGERHRQPTSVLSSKPVNESIAEEPAARPPHNKAGPQAPQDQADRDLMARNEGLA